MGLEPALLTQSQSVLKATEPFKYVGLVQSSIGLGSGVAVAPSVYASAAHVFYNEGIDQWIRGSTIEIIPVHHQQIKSQDSGIAAAGFFRWDQYRERSMAEELPPGVTSLDTFNLDFVAAYSLSDLIKDGHSSRMVVDEEEMLGMMRSNREKTIVGYPADTSVIPVSNIGKMYWTLPGNYRFFWDGHELSDERDSDGFWTAVYTVYDVITYGGNSGGPLFIEGDDDRWYMNGVLVGGLVDGSLVRGVDERAWALVDSANRASSAQWLSRPTGLDGTASVSGIRLHWEDLSTLEVGYRIERRESEKFITVGEVNADTYTFLDTSVEEGKVYQYRVISMDAQGGEAPASARVTIRTPGANRLLADALGAPLLAISTGGESAAFPLTLGGVQSGDIEAFERSFVELKVQGPGFLKYSWKVSSEVNPNYGKRIGRNGFDWDVFDAFYFFREDVQQDFISGIDLEESNGIQLPSGLNTVRWEYRKDAYSDEGIDAGILKSIEWNPYSMAKIVYGGISVEGTPYYWAPWFGYYTVDQLPWSYHFEWGWLYLSELSNLSFWAYSLIPEIGWMHIQPEIYPLVYSSTQGWIYYYEGSGFFGKGQWMYLYEEDKYLQL